MDSGFKTIGRYRSLKDFRQAIKLMEIRRMYLTKILNYGLDSILIEENMTMSAI